ncbi:LysR family transcriptional regulator [Ferrimonas sediminum]|uniref:LysR family transcriptional regulator n=1 Tax=Ferrimonas sediminum TaxID=718193 RepID=UPI0015A36281|nr:LysR family transcriptional regulator [Ferrimonas sediminum]
MDVSVFFIFKKVYETNNVGIAAKELGFQSSKVSRSLTSLRNALDDELFYRRKSGLVPTATASKLYDNLSPALSLFTSAFDRIDSESSRSKKIIVHITPFLLSALSRRLKEECQQRKQDASDIVLLEGDENTSPNLLSGEADIVVSERPIYGRGVQHERIGQQESLFIIASKHHEVWSNTDIDSLRDLAKHRFLYQSREGFNDRIDPFESYCRDNNILPQEIYKVSSFCEWLANLSTGRYISFVGTKEVKDYTLQQGDFKAIAMSDDSINILHQSLMLPKFYLSYVDSMAEGERGRLLDTLRQLCTRLVSA